MRTVLIVEDNETDFYKIKSKFEGCNWKVLPDDYLVLDALYQESTKGDLIDEIERMIDNNRDTIGAIVLDINLFGKSDEEREGLNGILTAIRHKRTAKSSLWGELVPIVAHSKYDDLRTKEKALSSQEHVHAFIPKDIENGSLHDLELTCSALCSVFKLNINDSIMSEHAKEMFTSVMDVLETHDLASSARFNSLELLIKGDFYKHKEDYKILMNALLHNLPENKHETFIIEYNKELKELLGQDKVDQYLKQLEKNGFDFNDELRKCIKSGAASDFVDFIDKCISELIDVGANEIFPGGKLIGPGISTILKLLKHRLKEK